MREFADAGPWRARRHEADSSRALGEFAMKWVRRIGAGLAIVVLVAVAVVYAGSEWIIRSSHAASLPKIAADRSPAGVAEGARFAGMVGCRGCHGDTGQGVMMADIPGVIHVVAPPIAQAASTYSDPELARLIRHGVKRDGTALFVMPITGHANIADDDLSKIMGWVRSLKPAPTDLKDGIGYGPLGRAAMLGGKLKPEIDLVNHAPAARPGDTGAYLAASVCGGCHAVHEPRVAHDDGRFVPALAAIGPAYDPAAFKRLLRTGIGLSPRDLGLMTRVSKGDLSNLTDAEMDAIHAYLGKEAGAANPE
jgi:cytochrome c553